MSTITRVPVTSLTPAPWNPRLIRDHRFQNLCKSIEADPDFLEQRPILAQADGMVYAGNMRLRAVQHLGWADVPAIVADVPDQLAKERALRDNAGWGENVEQDLAELLYELKEAGSAIDLLGFDDAELSRLLDSVSGVEQLPEEDPADMEPPAEPITQPGDLWLLGEHRLLCGDSTKADNVDRLLAGERPQIVFTSPPYWYGFAYEQEQDWQAVLLFLRDVAALLAVHTAADGRIIINTGTAQGDRLTHEGAHMRLLIDEWQRVFAEAGWLMRYVRLWVKDGGLGMVAPQMDVIDQHSEFLGYFYHRGNGPFRGQERVSEPWALKGYWDDIQGEARKHEHVASFPVELATRNLRLFTRTGEAVWEPFCGAGTTIVAAEQLSRRCYAMELDPRYVDVAVRRWETLTGKQAVREPAQVAA